MTWHAVEARPKVLDASIEKEDKSLKKQLDRAKVYPLFHLDLVFYLFFCFNMTKTYE